jgi:hypothetical protein
VAELLDQVSGQEHRVSGTRTARIGRKVVLLSAKAMMRASTGGIQELIWMEVMFQPSQIDAVVQELGTREV